MDYVKMMDQIKAHPDFDKAGMVLCHNGVVRAFSREGRAVTGLEVTVNKDKLAEVLAEARATPGIVEVLVEIAADRPLKIGEDVMFLIVAGDIRDNVIATLSRTLDRIKTEVTAKTQFFTD